MACVVFEKGCLTDTELSVLRLVADGLTHKEIARSDDCTSSSYRTVETHVKHIAEKLGSKNAAHMITVAMEKGIIKLLSFFMVCVLSFNCVMPSVDSRVPLRRPPRAVRVSGTMARVRVERLGGAAA
jgi:DNA-binding CsgD family transcriptional regulator